MSNIERLRRLLVATLLAGGMAAVLLVTPGSFGSTGIAGAAGTNKGDLIAAPSNSEPAGTPRPIKLRPWLQFGHARPGGIATYHQVLFNHLDQTAEVTLQGGSLRGWDVGVTPTDTWTLPGYANIITATVGVPNDPEHRVDLERTRAVISGTTPYTTTAWLVTITRRVPWTDVPAGNWADDPIQFLVDQGVVSGYADGSFHPNDNVTRAQFAKMLVLGMGWQVQTPASPTFGDVPVSYWAYGFIETAAAHGVISGYADGTFHPAATVTRGQVAKMVFTARGWTMTSPIYTRFTDVRSDEWVYIYVQAISSAQVMSGYADNTFRPSAPATRAQIAKILALALYSDPNN